MHVTRQMRRRLCDVLEELWHDALVERYKIYTHSHVACWIAYCEPTKTGCETALRRTLIVAIPLASAT